MITLQREQIGVIRREVQPLLEEHWREIAHYQDIQLDVDWEFYTSAKTIRCFTARDEGRLVGYGAFFLSPNRHYRTSIQAVQDVLFVLPEFRGWTGFLLLRYCERQLKQEGAQVIYHHVKQAHPLLGQVLDRMGYEDIEVIKAKRLDRG